MRVRGLKVIARGLLAIGLVWGLYFLRANAFFRLYPVLMVFGALLIFSLSLRRTPLVEVFARRMGERLDARGVAYCRQVTRVWVAFLAAHFLVTLATVFASPEIWAFYNGCLAYVLMGALILGELIIRRKVRGV